MKRILFALLICAAACKPGADATSAPKGSVIVLGQLIDRTGSIATPSWAESIRLAVTHANQALKQSGKSVRFEVAEANSGNAPDMARAGALQLVKQQNAKAIITDSSQDDIGVNIECRISEINGRVHMKATLDLSTVVQHDKSNAQVPPMPIIGQLRIEVNALVNPGKPTLVASVDDPVTLRKFDVEATVTKVN